MHPLFWILLVLLVLMTVGAFPRWNYASTWGYGPSGIFGLMLVALVLYFFLSGRRF